MSANSHRGALGVLTSLFFMWGFITCLNDILIPHLKSIFVLNYAQVMLVQFCFFTAYFLVSVPSGRLVKRYGYQVGIMAGLLVASAGCALFYPAAAVVSYPLFLTALFVLASGITLLQVAANPYVTLLGEPHTAASRLNLTQAFNSLGTTLAPYFGSLMILNSTLKSSSEVQALEPAALKAYQATQAASVQLPYLGLAGTLLLIAGVFAVIKLPRIAALPSVSVSAHTIGSVWSYRHLVLGALAIFLYVGAEVAIGSFLIGFLGEADVAGLSAQVASQYVSFYWGGALVGRFVGATLMQRIPASNLLAFNAVFAVLLLSIAILGGGSVSMWAVLAIGLCNSIMFPTIFSLALEGLGEHTEQGSGILCAAIVGGAVIPLLQGVIADQLGLRWAFVLPAFCYGYIAYYGLRGCRYAAANA